MRGFIYKAVIIAFIFIIGFEFTIGKRIDPIVENIDKFDTSKMNNIQSLGITASASAPEVLVQDFIQYLKENYTINMLEPEYIREDINFNIPQQLKMNK